MASSSVERRGPSFYLHEFIPRLRSKYNKKKRPHRHERLQKKALDEVQESVEDLSRKNYALRSQVATLSEDIEKLVSKNQDLASLINVLWETNQKLKSQTGSYLQGLQQASPTPAGPEKGEEDLQKKMKIQLSVVKLTPEGGLKYA
jgi:predicted RNase H-like nuclease (RuvC/YqgF family)